MGYIDWPCVQKAVYWPPGSEATAGTDYDDYGNLQYGIAAEVDCRWDDKAEEVIMADGTRDMSRAQVIIDQDVSVRGVLFLGELADLSDLDNPKNNEGAFEIRQVTRNPDIDGEDILIMAYL
jgi:hypothetical protein